MKRFTPENNSLDETSPYLEVMRCYGAPPTLDEWLGLNNINIDYPFDAELFDTMPEQFHEEFTNRFSNFIRNDGGIQ